MSRRGQSNQSVQLFHTNQGIHVPCVTRTFEQEHDGNVYKNYTMTLTSVNRMFILDRTICGTDQDIL